MRKLMVTIIKRMGAKRVIEAQHGGEALDLLQSSRVDLVLTDWSMPVMDGIELIQQLGGSAQFRSLPILIFTSRTDKEDVVAALKAGADSFIAKPFTPAQLKVRIADAIKKRNRPPVEDIFLGTDAAHKQDDYPW
jgi:two-component system chemotaxis response regulator CheY